MPAGLYAITVGFHLDHDHGHAARIVPAFAAIRLYNRGLLIGTWWCLMAGTALRVPSQALYTAVGGLVVPLLGQSGVIQLGGADAVCLESVGNAGDERYPIC
jgi:hypothetical protein